MMQPSGRTMHNGKIYELWGDQLWEYRMGFVTGVCSEGELVWTRPTGNPKYPDSPIGYCEDSDSLHECGRDRSVVGIHECGLPGCHLPSDSGDIA